MKNPDTREVITAHGLNHWFGEGELRKQILYDVTLSIQSGEIVILTGPSGSGKTTLLTLIGALRTVEEGSLCVMNRELNGASRETILATRRHLGFVFQAHNLHRSLTALGNVIMGLEVQGELTRDEMEARGRLVLDEVGLSQRTSYYPAQLSGGQKQRVAIARALVGRPAILLADEPTAALDSHSGREVVELMQKLAREQKTTILMVTHDNRVLDIADRIVEMEDGRLHSAALRAKEGVLTQSL